MLTSGASLLEGNTAGALSIAIEQEAVNHRVILCAWRTPRRKGSNWKQDIVGVVIGGRKQAGKGC